MAEQIFKIPQGQRRDQEDDYAEDEGWKPQTGRSAGVSADAKNSINKIEDLLNEEGGQVTANDKKVGGLYNPKGDSVDAGGLQNLESGAGGGAAGGLAPSLTGNTPASGLLKGGVAGGAATLIGRLADNKRRNTIGGVAGGGIVAGIFFIATIASGPGQLIRYGQLLANISPFQHQQSSSTGEMDKLMRWAKSRDVGETRLSRLGSLTNKKIQADFAKEGIAINTDPISGQMKSISIDTSKSSKYAGLSDADVRIQIAADNGIPVDSVHRINGINGSAKFAFSTKGMSTTARRSVIGGFVDDQELGKLSTFVRFRTLTSYYNENSWLHPFKKAAAAADQKLSDKLRAKALAADADSRLKKLTAKSDSVKAFNEGIRSKISPGAYKAVTGALIATSGICLAKDIVHAVPEINRLNVVEPAIVSAGDALALGSQIETGQGVDFGQVGAAVTSLTDAQGTTPWQSAGIQRLDGNATGGVAANTGVSQAFSGDSNEVAIENDLNALGANALCSTIGQIGQGIAGVALLVTGAGGLIEKGLQTAGSLAIGVVIGQLTQSVTKIIANDPITGVPHQGVAGGNVDALGDIALADSNAVAMGGTQLSPAETAELDSTTPMNQDFTSQSFASRVFNTNDYRSVAGNFLDSQNPVVTQNVTKTTASILTGFTHIGSSFANLASILLPKAQAAPTTPYGLGVPEFGFSRADLNNPLYEDPYANADVAAKLFDNDGANQYIGKAKTCFGVTISKDTNGDWGAVGSNQINTASSDYTNANCNDASTQWKQVRFFILDTGLMEGYACDQLDDNQSCADSGWGSSGTTASTGTTTVPTGDQKSLAQQVLANSHVSFANDSDKQDIVATVQGTPMTCTDANGTITLTSGISASLLSVMLQLGQNYDYRVSALFSGHGGPKTNGCSDGGEHPLGRAVDIDSINGNVISGTASTEDSARYSGDTDLDRKFINSALTILPKGAFVNKVPVGMGGSGQLQCLSPRVAIPSGINAFNDFCTHVHLDVGTRDN